jgi:hypothetical protein
VCNAPGILFYVVPQEAGHNNLFSQVPLMDKYIGFDIDSKKIVACVVENGKKDIYQTLRSDTCSSYTITESRCCSVFWYRIVFFIENNIGKIKLFK